MKRISALFLCLTLIFTMFAGCGAGENTDESNRKTLVAGATTGFFGAESLDVAHNWDGQTTLAIDSIEADGQTLTIKTPEENPTMLNELCDPLLGIYDAGGTVDEVLGVSCTGPYKAVDFTAMTEVSMVKNEYYWGTQPKLDEVQLKIMDDANALQMALQNGEIDMIAQLDAQSADLFSDTEKYTVKGVTSSRSDFLMYNLNAPGVDDPAVRRAIGYCIDRESFAKVVYNHYAQVCYGVYPDIFEFGKTDSLTLNVDRYDVDAAKQILSDAGYTDTDGDGILDKDGVSLSFSVITYSYNTASIQLCDMLQSALAQVGIGMEITTYDVLDDYLQNGEFDIAVLSYAMAPIGTPGYFINMLFTSGASNNYGGYSNVRVDTLTDELSAEFNSERQTDIVLQICQEIIDDRPFDFVANQQLICVWNNKVTGVEVNPSEYYLITADLDIEE